MYFYNIPHDIIYKHGCPAVSKDLRQWLTTVSLQLFTPNNWPFRIMGKTIKMQLEHLLEDIILQSLSPVPQDTEYTLNNIYICISYSSILLITKIWMCEGHISL